MDYLHKAERISRRLIPESMITGMGCTALAAALDISIFSDRAAEISAQIGSVMTALGGIALAIDLYRLRQLESRGYFPEDPDEDPDKEPIKPETQVIELFTGQHVDQDAHKAA